MRSAKAVGLTLAGVFWFTGCLAQTQTAFSAHGRAWSLTREGVLLREAEVQKRISVPLPGWHWAGAPYGAAPELALGPTGEAIVTSDVLPVLWRIDPATLAVSVHQLVLESDAEQDIGFTRLVYSREHDAFLALGGARGSLWIIDRALTRARKLEGNLLRQ